MEIIILLVVVVVLLVAVPDIRRSLITRPAFAFFKRVLPPLSPTEREAMQAGDTWWDADLFSGRPDWHKFHQTKAPQFTEAEQAFIDNQLETLLAMLDDFRIVQQDSDLPKKVWDYIRKEKFFAMIIGKEFGGLDFSPAANSHIVSRIATRSISAAVSVMVPNSLGPGELLTHYGTDEQKNYWLPRLADGTDIPCFALTGPEAGSDAGAIPDTGIICKGEFEGKEVVGIRLNWSKRYITLAPVATVLGLAFKLYDPDGLMGEQKDIGITCALIPTNHPGVETGERHLPLNQAFMNGTTYGKDVFIPLDWIIGGKDYAGKGWRMLMECLSAGRGISLPALAAATGHVTERMTGAYGYVRQQFGMPIGLFEGVQAAMGKIGGTNYTLESMRRLTVTALCEGKSPSVITAMTKYHMTEMGRQVMDAAMDVHAGKGIQLGPRNYLGHGYMATPVSITVEGANILTRNLMIFGQGATRCHPYVLAEMEAASNPNEDEGLQQFDSLLLKHIGFAAGNFFGSLFMGLTGARFNASPMSGPTARYYQQLTRMSRALALTADMAMLVMGGDLKRREMLSARLGDVLSHLYMASAVLKRYEDDGRQSGDLPFVEYALEHHLYEIGQAFKGFFANFPSRIVAWTLRLAIFPLGIHYNKPSDANLQAVAKSMMEPGVTRDRHTFLCYWKDDANDMTGHMELAFLAMREHADVYKRIRKAVKLGDIAEDLSGDELVKAARKAEVITADEAKSLKKTEQLRMTAIGVDQFAPGVIEQRKFYS
ncbi:acyl-CoA dehydrogenase [Pseudidiomarina andamanensis]|uniref:Acyl-coenzyme A dehydrogenase n=1 Tax=Pseudidiomarina andamanensis TaxID=1940690 RepID=A0AA92ES09_9GAMM|nr:acyl-CoA dehydrogenase [Pseudidiomarina andamanensis]MDS0218017.1 acyl-CoA dehydrogenase [Pseudidiomarina andamanensis]QGT94908.1 acyl-CoA dehydrogenase [Pseudidiomarina andamanensis]